MKPIKRSQIDKIVDMYEELGVDRLATWTYRGGYGTSVAAKHGFMITWGRYCKQAAPATIIVLAISTGIIILRYCVLKF